MTDVRPASPYIRHEVGRGLGHRRHERSRGLRLSSPRDLDDKEPRGVEVIHPNPSQHRPRQHTKPRINGQRPPKLVDVQDPIECGDGKDFHHLRRRAGEMQTLVISGPKLLVDVDERGQAAGVAERQAGQVQDDSARAAGHQLMQGLVEIPAGRKVELTTQRDDRGSVIGWAGESAVHSSA